MEQEFQIKGTTLTIRLPKEIDHHNAEEIRGEADRILQRKLIRVIVFDFRETEFMDSSGIGMIMGRYRALGLQKDCAEAIHVNQRINRILHLSGLHKYIGIQQGEVQESKHE